MTSIADILKTSAAYAADLPAVPQPIQPPVGGDIAAWIDHTLLKPDATEEQVRKLCAEARQYHFASVCVNPVWVRFAAEQLAGSGVPVCAVAGFPLGATPAMLKVLEALTCLNAGAREIDMVMNIGALRGEAWSVVLDDIQAVADNVHNQDGLLKVILETGALTRSEKITACLLCEAAGADFVKTSTGFGPGGATVEDVDLMYRVVGGRLKVKASGGIRNYATALAMVQAGATRLGASAGVQIVQEAVQ